MDWLDSTAEPREATVALAADLLDPHSNDIHRRGPSVWLKPFRQGKVEADKYSKIRLQAFLLALGFDNTGSRADELVVRSFGTVHDALARDALSYDSWTWIQEQVPTLSWLRNWDRCERLRRGLAEQFSKNGWPASQFVRCAADADMLRQMLESCRKAHGENSLLRRLRASWSAAEIQCDNECQKILNEYI